MEKLKEKTGLKHLPELNKQLIKFTLIGILAVLTDLLFYFIFLQIIPEKVLSFLSTEALSKGLSFICGIFVTYNLNKYWTWRQRDRSHTRLIKFSSLYSASLLLNVTVNSVTLYALHNFENLAFLPKKYLIAFVAATGSSAMFNFVGQKFWVFKPGEGINAPNEES